MAFINYLRRLNAIDFLLLAYTAITFAYILVFSKEIPSAYLHLFSRCLFIGLILCLPLLDKYIKKPLYQFLRIAYPLLFISFFYSETDALNNIFFQNLDYHFARIDASMFGYQPSLAFYNSFPQKWFSELMNFGYFSYYFIIAGYSIYIFIKDTNSFFKTVFLITCSFLLYYLIFIALPVSGPQYFFEPPHNQIADSGIFRKLVLFVEYIGERPTAAFPSSHVGMVFILILMAWNKYLITWVWLVPLFILLSLSTVYIKAHYAVDVIGGLISAPIILFLSKAIYNLFSRYFLTSKTAYANGIDC